MNGTDGISSLQKALGSLHLTDTKQAKPTDGLRQAQSVDLQARASDQANVSEAGGLAAQATSDGDVRLDKVAALQQQIAAGTYNVPASAVAGKLVESLLSGS